MFGLLCEAGELDGNRSPHSLLDVSESNVSDSEQRDRRIVERVVERDLHFANRSHREKPNPPTQRRAYFGVTRQDELRGFDKIIGFPCIPNQRAQLAFK